MRALLLTLLLSSSGRAGQCDAVDCTWTVGMKLLREARYAEALPWLEQGFRLSQDPKFLFEIGEAHRLAGKDAQAIVAYESYVKIAPYAANLKEVEALLAECRLRVEEQRAFFQPPPQRPDGAPMRSWDRAEA